MIPDFTLSQLQQLTLDRNAPLVICDVDEVVVHFTSSFEDYLRAHNLYLDTSSFAINGNIRDCQTNQPVANTRVSALIDAFFVDCTETLPPIEGAVDALEALAQHATVVMLTNLPHHAREKRINNLRGLGLPYPVITNSGPKGPAINHLAALSDRPIVFVDDSPNFIASSYEHAPHVHLVHFLQDPRFARHLEPFPYVSLTTDSWSKAQPHILSLLV